MKNLDQLKQEARQLHQSGRLEEAGSAYREYLRRKPNDANVVSLLAGLRADQRRWPEALAQAEKATRLEPRNASIQFQRALALHALGRSSETLEVLRIVCGLDAHFPRARTILAQLSMENCDWAEFDRHVAELAELAKDPAASVDAFLLLQICDDPELHRICAENYLRSAQALYRNLVPAKAFSHQPRQRGKIRIGYLSGDFRNHPTTHLISELIEVHNREGFEIIGISTGPDDGSPYRARIAAAFDWFIDALDWPLNEVAQRLAALEVDVIVDLSGHTKLNQLPFLASRPAPVQVSYLGYPGTTGADFIDYCIADAFAVPADQASSYREKIVHLPGSYQVNDRNRPVASGAPARAEYGLPENAFVFCCFNSATRLAPKTFNIWMRLMDTVPGSVLWLLEQSSEAAGNLRREALTRGVALDRIVFAPKVPLDQHLARLPLADLVLDTFPYNGHTNTSDALWMGVPAVTVAGRSFGARVAGSLLSAHGFPELVTTSLGEYEALARVLAGDPQRLRSLRDRLKDCRDRSPVFDTHRFCAHIEMAYRKMYETWRAGDAPQSFAVEPASSQ